MIDRTIDPELQLRLNALSHTIEQFVNFGVMLLERDVKSPKRHEFQLAPTMSFRHFLDLADSVSVLVKNSCADSCELILRGMLESYLSLAYMLEKDQDRRAMSFMVFHYHKNIKKLSLGVEGSTLRQNLIANLRKDKYLYDIEWPVDKEAEGKIKQIEYRLDEDYKAIEAEYQRCNKKGRLPWYSLFGGPQDLEQLARHLGETGVYEGFYRVWSETAHATNVINGKISREVGSGPQISDLRRWEESQPATRAALFLFAKMLDVYTQKRQPAESNGYIAFFQSVHTSFTRIMDPDPIIIPT